MGTGFSASSGSLQKWMNRYSIAEFQTAEEDGEVNPETLKLSADKDMNQKTFGTQVKQS